jgi:hypothetical protein
MGVASPVGAAGSILPDEQTGIARGGRRFDVLVDHNFASCVARDPGPFFRRVRCLKSLFVGRSMERQPDQKLDRQVEGEHNQ